MKNAKKSLTVMDFKHATELNWTDISSEEYRTYEFADSIIKINGPLMLNISKSGGHRIFDNQGISHYIPSGYRHLSWKAKENMPHFVT